MMTELSGLDDLRSLTPTQWFNPSVTGTDAAWLPRIDEADQRLRRWAPWIATHFPDTRATAGIIESPLVALPSMHAALEERTGVPIPGQLWAKLDSHLPVSGSIKARGGIHEVLQYAEHVAVQTGRVSCVDEVPALSDDAKHIAFAGHAVSVGSTGNLGLSIGIIAAALGLRVVVHMSADAREWKKAKLRALGVQVVEHADDYSVAVAQARAEAVADPSMHFVDDEHSESLFLGYAVAGRRLARQLQWRGRRIDEEQPLVLHLPCGVGGGPGGVFLGAKLALGGAVHGLFAEPTHSPCLQLALRTGLGDRISVQDIGIDNRTAADGLAVGRASGLVAPIMQQILDGCFSLTDEQMYRHVALLHRTEGIDVEPSAAAGFDGPLRWVAEHPDAPAATHVVWCTGGSMVPPDQMVDFITTGERLLG